MTVAVRRTGRAGGAAFTLIEMLVVIGIIALLLAITTVAGVAVIRRNTVNTTRNVLRTLDRALDEYLITTGGVPPKYDPAQYSMVPGPDFERPGDAANDFGSPNGGAFARYPAASQGVHPRFPDASVFLRQSKGVGAVDGVVQQIPQRFLQVTVTPGATSDLVAANTTPSVVDSWADNGWITPWPLRQQQLILYVHPDNLLAQDLYGRCQNRRPYFMSAGPDKVYGSDRKGATETDEAFLARMNAALEDNVYSYPGVAGTHNKNMAASERKIP